MDVGGEREKGKTVHAKEGEGEGSMVRIKVFILSSPFPFSFPGRRPLAECNKIVFDARPLLMDFFCEHK